MTRTTRRHRLTAGLLAVYLVLLSGIILFKAPFRSPALGTIRVLNLIPFAGSCDGQGHLLWGEIVGNTLLFVPLGIYLGMLDHWAFAKRVLAIAGSSLGFEFTQYVLGLGVADITDLVDNTVGGVLGLGIIKLLTSVFGARTPGIVNIVASAATAAALARFGYLYYLSHFVVGLPPQ
ncbi:MAG: VanZ family protein [Bifidobacteriaceae bacterium]|jgi:glycopeptide antibiotics resistance protein|nr:VanZ family protein [Bifidobacteriaceae bacterium]